MDVDPEHPQREGKGRKRRRKKEERRSTSTYWKPTNHHKFCGNTTNISASRQERSRLEHAYSFDYKVCRLAAGTPYLARRTIARRQLSVGKREIPVKCAPAIARNLDRQLRETYRQTCCEVYKLTKKIPNAFSFSQMKMTFLKWKLCCLKNSLLTSSGLVG